MTEVFTVESCIRGYHVYKEIWESIIGEQLNFFREEMLRLHLSGSNKMNMEVSKSLSNILQRKTFL